MARQNAAASNNRIDKDFLVAEEVFGRMPAHFRTGDGERD